MKHILKNSQRYLLIASLIGLVMACSKPREEASTGTDSVAIVSDEAASGEVKSEEVRQDDSGVKLKGIYATSTKIPASQYGSDNLFDGDSKTFWSTMPNAGPDEGIMLYFQSPESISHLEIVQPQAENLATIQAISVYVNGNAFGDYKVENSKIELKATNVQSLFIKIDGVAGMSQEEDEAVVIMSFVPSYSIGISEIKLYSGNTLMAITLPSAVAGTMTASSTLEPAISYGIRNLFDSRKEFVWVEGAKGSGENESLKFKFNSDQEITGIKIMNGFQRSEKHFTANGRVKSLIISNEKNESREVALTNEQGEQTLSLDSPLSGKEITLKVKAIYPGTTYKDLVLSELKFINKNGDFIIEDNVTENIKQDLLKKSKNTILEKILDTRIYNQYEEMDGYKRSIILRSDYTFVAYSEDWTEMSSGSETNEIVADGNWEIKELGEGHAKIRIFGKLIRLSESTDYYQGNSSDTYLQIFQDNLNIDIVSITGDKFIQQLMLPKDEN